MGIWQGLQRGDTAAITIFCVLVAAGAIALFIIQHVVRKLVERRVRRRRGVDDASFGEVAAMKQRGLLTDEEAKLVRAALARRFAEEQAPATHAPAELPGDALARLAIEAEQLERDLRSRREAVPPAAGPRPAPASQDTEASPIPERLRNLAGKPFLELEELASAGFITDEDLELLKEHATP